MEIDLTKLSELSTPERTCLSLYLAAPKSKKDLNSRFERFRRVLKKGGAAGKDEREHFDENVNVIRKYLEKNPFHSGSLCLFSCWILDFFQAYSIEAPVKDLIWIDSSPYIRPLAELQDEYEDAAVVIADNKRARIFLVSSTGSESENIIKGNIKNHVRKGGWSQQRYERRRDKELLLYAREIVDALRELSKVESFRRIVLVGGKEILRIVYDNLPEHMKPMVGKKAVDVHRDDESLNKDILEIFTEQERRSEHDLWEKIRSEYLRDNLGIVGLANVLAVAQTGQIETMIVDRTFEPMGKRCRECEHLMIGDPGTCDRCGSDSLFDVDVVNEIVELLKSTGADVDFTDPIDTLTEAGHIAALLRYTY